MAVHEARSTASAAFNVVNCFRRVLHHRERKIAGTCRCASASQRTTTAPSRVFHVYDAFRRGIRPMLAVARTADLCPVHTSNNVEATFDFVERIFRLVAFDNVAATLLLVWTGLYSVRTSFGGLGFSVPAHKIWNSLPPAPRMCFRSDTCRPSSREPLFSAGAQSPQHLASKIQLLLTIVYV